ncbi:MAG: glycosyl hydrolase [Candidatus Caccosoma sp.]|nr:glycosyl hydrolase [Candidatus Caccosoma sp.]
MKHKYLLMCLSAFLLSTITGCKNNNNEEVELVKEDEVFDENYESIIDLKNVKKEDGLMYSEMDFGEFSGLKNQALYYNNILDNSKREGNITEEDDPKYIFYSNDKFRFVNRSEGYALNLKTNTTVVGDFKVAKYRSKIYNRDYTLTISKENVKPTGYSWSTYRDEWLTRYISNPEYLSDNNLKYSHDTIFENKEILNGYEISVYSIQILDPGLIRKPYYNIAIIKDLSTFDIFGGDQSRCFYQVILKSTNDMHNDFMDMVKTFTKIESVGTSKNHLNDLPLIYNENWNETTKKYFTKLSTQQRTDWGIYTYNINKPGDLQDTIRRFESVLDYNFDITPTYAHLNEPFDLNGANATAGGNGYNNKKVLQFSYQFTTNNNNVSVSNRTNCETPMFDILRGPSSKDRKIWSEGDARDRIMWKFISLAKRLKEYNEPVLFRLNNEMNSDWTSYCGMMTLNDPDIFIATWRRLYNVFEEEGVQNCIWIFNPIGTTVPFCNWGEDMSYFPGTKYVQALGLTEYEDNNSNNVNVYTFRQDYTRYYEKNKNTWSAYPWIISEFGCGAGGNYSGERFRNEKSQANYVKGMFADFNDRENNPYLQNIKGAVWFSANDYVGDKVSNQYELVIDKLPNTMEALKEGLAKNKNK